MALDHSTRKTKSKYNTFDHTSTPLFKGIEGKGKGIDNSERAVFFIA